MLVFASAVVGGGGRIPKYEYEFIFLLNPTVEITNLIFLLVK